MLRENNEQHPVLANININSANIKLKLYLNQNILQLQPWVWEIPFTARRSSQRCLPYLGDNRAWDKFLRPSTYGAVVTIGTYSNAALRPRPREAKDMQDVETALNCNSCNVFLTLSSVFFFCCELPAYQTFAAGPRKHKHP